MTGGGVASRAFSAASRTGVLQDVLINVMPAVSATAIGAHPDAGKRIAIRTFRLARTFAATGEPIISGSATRMAHGPEKLSHPPQSNRRPAAYESISDGPRRTDTESRQQKIEQIGPLLRRVHQRPGESVAFPSCQEGAVAKHSICGASGEPNGEKRWSFIDTASNRCTSPRCAAAPSLGEIAGA